jgi:DNA-binding NtrC family response regulator
VNPNQKLLVVDDNLDFAETLAIQLALSGHAAVAVGSVEQALDILDEDPTIGAVVSDVRMPDVDGLDFRRVLRHRFPNLPVILMTGLPVEEEDLARARVLQKPFPVTELIAALARLE